MGRATVMTAGVVGSREWGGWREIREGRGEQEREPRRHACSGEGARTGGNEVADFQS